VSYTNSISIKIINISLSPLAGEGSEEGEAGQKYSIELEMELVDKNRPCPSMLLRTGFDRLSTNGFWATHQFGE
jgi:hypothetical protein